MNFATNVNLTGLAAAQACQGLKLCMECLANTCAWYPENKFCYPYAEAGKNWLVAGPDAEQRCRDSEPTTTTVPPMSTDTPKDSGVNWYGWWLVVVIIFIFAFCFGLYAEQERKLQYMQQQLDAGQKKKTQGRQAQAASVQRV